MTAYRTQCLLSTSDNPEAPVRLRMMAAKPNEEGVRSGFHQDLSCDEARALAADLQQAARWIESGAWKVTT